MQRHKEKYFWSDGKIASQTPFLCKSTRALAKFFKINREREGGKTEDTLTGKLNYYYKKVRCKQEETQIQVSEAQFVIIVKF